MTPLWLALAGLGLILAAVWALVSNNSRDRAGIEVTGAPSLKADTTLIDHGDVKLGTPLRDEVRITNVGDQPLRFIEEPYVEIREGC